MVTLVVGGGPAALISAHAMTLRFTAWLTYHYKVTSFFSIPKYVRAKKNSIFDFVGFVGPFLESPDSPAVFHMDGRQTPRGARACQFLIDEVV